MEASSCTPARVVVVGAQGRMGALACRLLDESADFEVAAALDVGQDLPRALGDVDAALGLDLTVAGLGLAHGRLMLEAGLRPVIGTSGVDQQQTAELDALARRRGLGGIVVPNFSLGLWVLERALSEAARHFEAAEIVELHHLRKRDAPSGTAVHLAEVVSRSRGGTEQPPIHSVRLPGLYAHHEVLLGAPGETLTLRHDMSGPEAFRPGILMALAYARTALGVARGLDVVFRARGD